MAVRESPRLKPWEMPTAIAFRPPWGRPEPTKNHVKPQTAQNNRQKVFSILEVIPRAAYAESMPPRRPYRLRCMQFTDPSKALKQHADNLPKSAKKRQKTTVRPNCDPVISPRFHRNGYGDPGFREAGSYRDPIARADAKDFAAPPQNSIRLPTLCGQRRSP
jgi:hypothetical protein